MHHKALKKAACYTPRDTHYTGYRGRLTNSEHTYTLGKCTHSHTRAIDLCKGLPCRGISQVATCTGGPKARMSSLPAGEPTQRSSCFLLASAAQKTRHNNHCLTAYQAQRHSFYGGAFARCVMKADHAHVTHSKQSGVECACACVLRITNCISSDPEHFMGLMVLGLSFIKVLPF